MATPDHESREADVTVEFGHEAAAPSLVRRAVRPLISDDGDPIAAAVETVVSELVANVVHHTQGGGTFRAWDPKPELPFHVGVSDTDPARPVVRAADAAGGRGMRIVDELADAWGVEADGDGKTVWAEFNRPG
jgi:hypothetical protein